MAVVTLVLDLEVECLLRQIAADFQMSPEELGTVVLSSALLSQKDT